MWGHSLKAADGGRGAEEASRLVLVPSNSSGGEDSPTQDDDPGVAAGSQGLEAGGNGLRNCVARVPQQWSFQPYKASNYSFYTRFRYKKALDGIIFMYLGLNPEALYIKVKDEKM
ncbi:hypothetical protein ACLOJK_011454 [Asimina triloba]